MKNYFKLIFLFTIVSCDFVRQKKSFHATSESSQNNIQKILEIYDLEILDLFEISKVTYWSESLGDGIFGSQDISFYFVFEISKLVNSKRLYAFTNSKNCSYVKSRDNEALWISEKQFLVAVEEGKVYSIDNKKNGWFAWLQGENKVFVFLQTR